MIINRRRKGRVRDKRKDIKKEGEARDNEEKKEEEEKKKRKKEKRYEDSESGAHFYVSPEENAFPSP